MYTLSSTGINRYLTDVVCAMYKADDHVTFMPHSRYCDNCLGDLERYISSGRAPTEFIKSMLNTPIDVMAATLLKRGSPDDRVSKIKWLVRKYKPKENTL